MDTVFFTPGPSGTHLTTNGGPTPGTILDSMNTASKAIAGQMLDASVAANDDRLGDRSGEPQRAAIDVHETQASAAGGIEATGGWDAYDVWKRFIKEARDRRKNHD